MFSNRDGIHIPVSGGTPWVQVPMNSNYPSQEIWQDGNKYAPLSEVNRPRPSAPVAYTGNRDINTELSIQRYQQGYARREELEEQERRQQEALINKQLDIAASTQQNEMDKLYIQGGLDEMRKEYYRVSAGSEGPYSVYAKAAYKVLCAKEKEEAPIREETTKSANNYYNEGGIDNLKYLINFYKSRGEFNYASVAQSLLNAKEKEEAINTPAVTKGANEYYATGGMASLKHLVNSYKDSNDFVNYNIAKRILKQKEEEEHNRRMQQDPEYAENYKIKEAENEICKLEKEIEEQKKINPFYGQPSSAAINERIKAFEHSKSLGYEGARAYLAELSLPANARFEHSKIGAAVALQNYFDKVIPLQNKIEQAKAKIQEIENVRTERTKQLLAKAEKEIEDLIVREVNLQMPVTDEEQLRKIIHEKLEEYPTPESRREFIETLPEDVKLRAMQYTLPESSDGYQTVSAGVIGGITTLIGAIAALGMEAYKDSVRNGQSSQVQERFDESVYESLDHSLDTGPERNSGYQPGREHGADQGDRPTGFLPQFNRDRESGKRIQPVPNHPELRPGNDQGFLSENVQGNPLETDIERDKLFLETLHIYKAVKDLQIGRYGDLQRDADPHDGMHHDHWPSAAAIIKAEEDKIGRKLGKVQRDQIIRNTNAIVIVEKLHFKSRTFGGKNTAAQIEIDSKDLAAAAAKDAEVFRENALRSVYNPKEVDEAIQMMHTINRKCGLY